MACKLAFAFCAALMAFVSPTLAQTKPATPPPASAPAPAALQAQVEQARSLYLDGDFAAALAILLPAAEAGNPMAQNILGDAYNTGSGVAQDYLLARDWWQRASDGGDPYAPMNLGEMLQTGRPGIDPDPGAAQDYYLISARRGYGTAMVALGWMLQHGAGGPVDLPGALDWYRQGREAGARWAFEYEGHLHLNGTGVPRDHARARELFDHAAEAGIPQSMNNLGVLLRDGLGGPADPARAEEWFRVAIDQGYTRAAFNLVELLAASSDSAAIAEAARLCDWGGARDPDLARGWFTDCLTVAKHARAAG